MNNCSLLAQWWEETLAGDVRSFSRIHDELYSGLYYYLFKIVKDEDVARDVLQDLFVKFWERREKLGLIVNVKYYFFKSARSMAINYLKMYKPELLDLQKHREVDLGFSSEDIIVSKEAGLETQKRLAMALNMLPKRQKEMIFLRYFDDWGYDQIAEVTGLQYQSVVNHVHRGINQLRLTLSESKSVMQIELAI
ncbi:sigma-70 family RNA polymerase sigma factor [Mucilaginibacter sp.]|uniref:RNA polymerase sigma factor n=1 Tax=Mucilaginibacter sp. TaxID=1882438 RepID=UPI0032644DDB